MGVGGQRHVSAALPPGKTLDGCGKSRPPTGIRSPDRPARSESLYRLRYRYAYCHFSLKSPNYLHEAESVLEN